MVLLPQDESDARTGLYFGVTAQAEIIVRLNQHLAIDASMRRVTNGATFAQRLMLENEGPRLIPVARGAGLVQSGHRQTSGGLHDVTSVRIVALDTIHAPFDDRVMLRQVELGMNLEMTIETRRRILARVDNQTIAPAASRDMPAARSVT